MKKEVKEGIDMLTYEEWKEALIRRLEKTLGEGTEVVANTKRSNGETEENFLIRRPGYLIVPLVSLDGLYRKYLAGETLEQCLERFAETDQNRAMDIERRPPDWEEARWCVRPVLVNREWNRGMLENVPYREYLDLAVICRVILAETETAFISSNIGWEQMECWGISQTQLWAEARKNLMAEQFWKKDIITLLEENLKTSILTPEELGLEDLAEIRKEMAGHMYVMSNKKKRYGAAALLRKDLMAEFAKEKGCSFFILPSSLHDLILVPDQGWYTANELCQIMRTTNREQLQRTEWLSDRVYYYDRESRSIEIAGDVGSWL